MFDNIGWGEILVVCIIGLIIIGPERLPKVIEDCRAAIFAARKAINNAKAELNGEFDGAFDDFKEPLQQVAKFASMSPRAAITKHLLDGDDFVEDLRKSGKPDISGTHSSPATNNAQNQQPAVAPGNTDNTVYIPPTQQSSQAMPPHNAQQGNTGSHPGFSYGNGNSRGYDDIM